MNLVYGLTCKLWLSVWVTHSVSDSWWVTHKEWLTVWVVLKLLTRQVCGQVCVINLWIKVLQHSESLRFTIQTILAIVFLLLPSHVVLHAVAGPNSGSTSWAKPALVNSKLVRMRSSCVWKVCRSLSWKSGIIAAVQNSFAWYCTTCNKCPWACIN